MKKKKLGKKKILKSAFRMVYDASLQLLLFELMYKGLILVIFRPILNVIVSLFIRTGGYKMLVNGEATQFLFSFAGIFMTIIVMTLSVLLIYYEFSVLLLILDSNRKKKETSLLEITETALVKLENVIKNKQLGLGLYLVVLIPILNIGIQSALIPTLSIPDFIIGELAKYQGSEVLFFLFGFALIYLFAKLFIVLPIMVFSGETFKEASKLSFKTIKGEALQVTFLILTGVVIWLTLTYLPFKLLENAQFVVLRIVRSISNISLTLFTLLISPFVLSISLETYAGYVQSGDLTRYNKSETIKIGCFGKKIWNALEFILGFLQYLLLKVKKHVKIVILLIFILISGFNIYAEESVMPIYDKQLLIGHRGGEYGVENTTSTILYAGMNGADYVEMDVLLTKDNVPVVIHDNNLKRLGKISKKISDLTADQVKQITIEGRGKKDTIPSLEDLSKEVKGKTKLLLEFKTHGKEKASIVDETIKVLEKEGVLNETTFHTTENDIIEEFYEKYTGLSMGYVFIGKIGTLSARKLAEMPVDFISAEESLIDKSLIREVHKAGKAVFAWTINDEYKAERLLELGVDGLITDYPVEMVKIRDKYLDFNEQ